ncbi:hypothetical protein RRG08_000841 [Elysia crispata]|uniref:Uncharacterized protein n=1 Tax=Elysia crispata TaxID=231223 RepID=A0AAE1DAH8_9GAST|nr:hypothetical protein RRG08_000841 [Elysia crispata]
MNVAVFSTSSTSLSLLTSILRHVARILLLQLDLTLSLLTSNMNSRQHILLLARPNYLFLTSTMNVAQYSLHS